MKARGRSVHEHGAMDPSYHCLLDSYEPATAVVMKRLLKNNKTEQKAKDKGGFILQRAAIAHQAIIFYFIISSFQPPQQSPDLYLKFEVKDKQTQTFNQRSNHQPIIMAQRLARIHGTEEDKVNCPFYFKIGACRHGDRCSRTHHRPAFSQTILVKHIYRHPVREAELRALATGQDSKALEMQIDDKKSLEDFLTFFEAMYEELGKFGRIECLCVCDNLGDHMLGHVYCKFIDEEEAADALNIMNGRYYDGKKMDVEFSPVTDFREARCRDFDEDTCARGGFCNFMHIKPVPMCLIRSLEEDVDYERRKEEERRRETDRDERRKRRKHSHREHRSSSRRERKRSRRDRSYSSSRSRSRSRDRSSSRSASPPPRNDNVQS